MNMFDEARAMSGTLALCKITQAELAGRLGVSQSYVANKLRLLSLPEGIQRKIIEHGVSERHERSLLRVSSEARQSEILDKIIDRGLTVRECEALVEMEVERDVPRIIEEARASERVTSFRSFVDGGIATLRSLGVDASAKTGYFGDKMYITICIREG